MTRPATLCLALALLSTGTAHAETIYRRVDANGNVTFSSAPPKPGEKAEQIEVDPNRNVVAPYITPETQQLEAEERQRYWQKQQQDEQRQQDRQTLIEQAEAQLRQAREALDAGKALQPGDLIGKRGGGTRPSPQRNERLHELEAQVKAAEENLEQVRRQQ